MLLTRRIALNGIQLDEVDERILIQSIEPQAGKEQTNAVSMWGGDGSRVTAQHREYLDVAVKFSLRIKPDAFMDRGELLEKVNAWATGTGAGRSGLMLTTNTKPGRKLIVIPWQLPGDGDALAWTNQYQITFRAYGVPYWQDELGTILRILDADSVNRQFGVPGNMNSTLDVEFKNTSGARIDTFTIRTGISVITLANLGLKNKETLVITHDDTGKRNLLRIYIINTDGEIRSVMDKRTTASSDDLITEPGTIRVRMSAGGTGTLLITGAGRYA